MRAYELDILKREKNKRKNEEESAIKIPLKRRMTISLLQSQSNKKSHEDDLTGSTRKQLRRVTSIEPTTSPLIAFNSKDPRWSDLSEQTTNENRFKFDLKGNKNNP